MSTANVHCEETLYFEPLQSRMVPWFESSFYHSWSKSGFIGPVNLFFIRYILYSIKRRRKGRSLVWFGCHCCTLVQVCRSRPFIPPARLSAW